MFHVTLGRAVRNIYTGINIMHIRKLHFSTRKLISLIIVTETKHWNSKIWTVRRILIRFSIFFDLNWFMKNLLVRVFWGIWTRISSELVSELPGKDKRYTRRLLECFDNSLYNGSKLITRGVLGVALLFCNNKCNNHSISNRGIWKCLATVRNYKNM